jgi:hypothetical protein
MVTVILTQTKDSMWGGKDGTIPNSITDGLAYLGHHRPVNSLVYLCKHASAHAIGKPGRSFTRFSPRTHYRSSTRPFDHHGLESLYLINLFQAGEWWAPYIRFPYGSGIYPPLSSCFMKTTKRWEALNYTLPLAKVVMKPTVYQSYLVYPFQGYCNNSRVYPFGLIPGWAMINLWNIGWLGSQITNKGVLTPYSYLYRGLLCQL